MLWPSDYSDIVSPTGAHQCHSTSTLFLLWSFFDNLAWVITWHLDGFSHSFTANTTDPTVRMHPTTCAGISGTASEEHFVQLLSFSSFFQKFMLSLSSCNIQRDPLWLTEWHVKSPRPGTHSAGAVHFHAIDFGLKLRQTIWAGHDPGFLPTTWNSPWTTAPDTRFRLSGILGPMSHVFVSKSWSWMQPTGYPSSGKVRPRTHSFWPMIPAATHLTRFGTSDKRSHLSMAWLDLKILWVPTKTRQSSKLHIAQ